MGVECNFFKWLVILFSLFSNNFLISKVISCVNLGEKNIAGLTSQFLLVGFSDQSGAICLATIEPFVPNGMKMH